MSKGRKWDHTQYDWLHENVRWRFCRLCGHGCPKDSINRSEILPMLGVGQRKAMLVCGTTCEEVLEMAPKDQAVWRRLTEEELEKLREISNRGKDGLE